MVSTRRVEGIVVYKSVSVCKFLNDGPEVLEPVVNEIVGELIDELKIVSSMDGVFLAVDNSGNYYKVSSILYFMPSNCRVIVELLVESASSMNDDKHTEGNTKEIVYNYVVERLKDRELADFVLKCCM